MALSLDFSFLYNSSKKGLSFADIGNEAKDQVTTVKLT